MRAMRDGWNVAGLSCAAQSDSRDAYFILEYKCNTNIETQFKMGSSSYLDALRQVLRGILEPFTPTITMTVYYGTNKLVNGRELNASMVKATPRVLIGGEADELYTLVMIDPDAPNPNEPLLKELVSWSLSLSLSNFNVFIQRLADTSNPDTIVTLTLWSDRDRHPGGKSCAEGTEFISYEGPNPHIGIHRYMLLLYKQRNSLNDVGKLESRVHFRVRAFAREHNLGNPVGIAYYNVRRQTKRKNRA
ncbi:hypothetical protein OSB04_025812 [Centaurea solstitialis]|uniref:Uncharacterized protein n=1 Tax=Centaurea solstitialis TaxID=347529 RepID=A0AA38SNR7_9ASTR|nr:hypothetical protein OSB04_025812 [Centaurea solstitialis]